MLVKELIKKLNYNVLQDFEIELDLNYGENSNTTMINIDYTDKIIVIIQGCNGL